MIDGIPHVRMNPPLRGRAELIRHISHSGKAPVPAIMYYQQIRKCGGFHETGIRNSSLWTGLLLML